MQNHIEAESPIKLSEWVNHFHTLLNSRDFDPGVDIHCENRKNNPLDFPFTPKEVQVGISSLKSGKCSCLDLISNEFIKVSADIFLPINRYWSNFLIKFFRLAECQSYGTFH